MNTPLPLTKLTEQVMALHQSHQLQIQQNKEAQIRLQRNFQQLMQMSSLMQKVVKENSKLKLEVESVKGELSMLKSMCSSNKGGRDEYRPQDNQQQVQVLPVKKSGGGGSKKELHMRSKKRSLDVVGSDKLMGMEKQDDDVVVFTGDGRKSSKSHHAAAPASDKLKSLSRLLRTHKTDEISNASTCSDVQQQGLLEALMFDNMPDLDLGQPFPLNNSGSSTLKTGSTVPFTITPNKSPVREDEDNDCALDENSVLQQSSVAVAAKQSLKSQISNSSQSSKSFSSARESIDDDKNGFDAVYQGKVQMPVPALVGTAASVSKRVSDTSRIPSSAPGRPYDAETRMGSEDTCREPEPVEPASKRFEQDNATGVEITFPVPAPVKYSNIALPSKGCAISVSTKANDDNDDFSIVGCDFHMQDLDDVSICPSTLSFSTQANSFHSMESRSQKERFVKFLKVLVRYLDSRNPELSLKAKKIVKEFFCNYTFNPDRTSLSCTAQSLLRKTIGEHHWKHANAYMCYLEKKGVFRNSGANITSKAIPSSSPSTASSEFKMTEFDI